jgi:hypothetical protein
MVKLSAREHFRIELARLVNVTFSAEMLDDDRRDYWLEVVEPAWDGLATFWDEVAPVPKEEWQPIILGALVACASPSQWRAPRLAAAKALADAKVKAKAEEARKRAQEFREKSRSEWMEKHGYEEKEVTVNTKAFWQAQSFGPASEVRRIDPSTGKVVESINLHDK